MGFGIILVAYQEGMPSRHSRQELRVSESLHARINECVAELIDDDSRHGGAEILIGMVKDNDEATDFLMARCAGTVVRCQFGDLPKQPGSGVFAEIVQSLDSMPPHNNEARAGESAEAEAEPEWEETRNKYKYLFWV
ncbi:hypothetical protein [Burkholderia pseudomultivorans]|uniref:Uncharacterized protein n=1 Tax=Burkholderia pseudomultivorans TaxID=1207504 RepID=A0ABU2E3C1_9BURK|nr:hypothetical protein [Burkholderia pseudomultivorans]MDR8726011.1 hypothetical protein [Burkholderia pseudomultivorans]MDR8735093.1 hypothetical protein [Burkholderia pseudomultivorans]MDR8741086.1 hypothetical protein [Burkholderia pseudomultivorans]MDR8754362.1 hypothetical protein [Burkholderia pseudomultivorans]MDR8777473.1 hypothetical protein [Burkholderia pseudomultivorans]